MKQYQKQILFERSELICLGLNLVKINEIKSRISYKKHLNQTES